MWRGLLITVRRLAKRPVFTITAVGTLAVGVGATTAIFSTVNATLLRPLPYPDSENLYTLGTAFVDGRWTTGRVTGAYLAGIRENAPSVEEVVAYFPTDAMIVTGEGRNRRVMVHGVTPGFFEMVGLPMELGTPPREEEGAVVVISHGLWEELYGGDPEVVGRSIDFTTGAPGTIVGVAPRDFAFPAGTEVWVVVDLSPTSVAHSYLGALRARPGTTQERLQAELDAVMTGVIEQYPLFTGRVFVVRPLLGSILGDLGSILLVVLAGAAVLLVLSCINVATLILARGMGQTKETAVRVALGAGWQRVVTGFLAEAFVLSAAGAAFGLLAAFVWVRTLLILGGSGLPRLDQVPFDGRVLLVAGLTLVTSTLIVAAAPAVRLSNPDIRGLLNENGRSVTGSRGTGRLLSGLVVAEIALAIVLVSGAGWLVRSYQNVVETDPGFLTDGRLVFEVQLGGSRYGQPVQPVIEMTPDGPVLRPPPGPPPLGPADWLRDLSDRLMAMGPVTAVGSAATFPLGPDWDVGYYIGVPGEPYDPDRQETSHRRPVSPGFFEAMGVRMVAGRDLAYDDPGSNVVVNEAFVRRFMPDRDPLQTPFGLGFPQVNFENLLTIVGVVGDVRYNSLTEDAAPIVYARGAGSRQTVVVATTLERPEELIPTVRAAMDELDPSVPALIEPLRNRLSVALVRHRMGLILMLVFAGASLVLAAIGIYGVIADATGRRRQELATRIALGATPAKLVGLILRQGRGLTLLGVGVGVGAAYLGGRLAASRLYEVRAEDPAILIAAALAVLSMTVVAYLLPAIRASRIPAAESLRGE